jgi:hypothetical protein
MPEKLISMLSQPDSACLNDVLKDEGHRTLTLPTAEYLIKMFVHPKSFSVNKSRKDRGNGMLTSLSRIPEHFVNLITGFNSDGLKSLLNDD